MCAGEVSLVGFVRSYALLWRTTWKDTMGVGLERVGGSGLRVKGFIGLLRH